MKFPRFVVPASMLGTAIGIGVIIKDRSQGPIYKDDTKFSGRTAIVTGGTSGIGKATAAELASRGGRVILGCRNLKAGLRARDDIITKTFNKNVEVRLIDLSSLDSINEFAQNIIREEKRVDILVNNAGVMQVSGKRKLTINGFEENLGINFLGAFLLTNLLLPKLKESGSGRIINVTSISMNKASINFADFNLSSSYEPYQAYGQSKLALMAFTKELSTRTEGEGVSSMAVYPGVTKTKLARGLSNSAVSSTITSPLSILMRTPENAAQTVAWCCLSPEAKSGKLYKDMKEIKWNELSAEDSKRLWLIAEKWTRLDLYSDSAS